MFGCGHGGPGGWCPWCVAQTYKPIAPITSPEAQAVFDAAIKVADANAHLGEPDYPLYHLREAVLRFRICESLNRR